MQIIIINQIVLKFRKERITIGTLSKFQISIDYENMKKIPNN